MGGRHLSRCARDSESPTPHREIRRQQRAALWQQREGGWPGPTIAMPYARMESDANMDEEETLRNLEDGGGDGGNMSPAPVTHPATGATYGVGRDGSASGAADGADDSPLRPFPGQAADAAAADGAAAGNSAAGGSAATNAEDSGVARQEAVPKPPVFPSARKTELEVQAANVKKQAEGRRGMSTYSTTWKAYNEYHVARYGEPAPRCPWTDMLWLTSTQGVQFVSYMGKAGKTSSQV